MYDEEIQEEIEENDGIVKDNDDKKIRISIKFSDKLEECDCPETTDSLIGSISNLITQGQRFNVNDYLITYSEKNEKDQHILRVSKLTQDGIKKEDLNFEKKYDEFVKLVKDNPTKEYQINFNIARFDIGHLPQHVDKVKIGIKNYGDYLSALVKSEFEATKGKLNLILLNESLKHIENNVINIHQEACSNCKAKKMVGSIYHCLICNCSLCECCSEDHEHPMIKEY